MTFHLLAVKIGSVLKTTLIDTGILQSFAFKLGDELASFLGQYATAKFVPNSTPGLDSSVKTDPRYVEALKVYERQVAESNVLQYQSLQAQEQFSKKLLIILEESQMILKQNKSNEIKAAWDRNNWFSELDREETLDILGQRKHQLLILAAPPKISQSCPNSFRENLVTEVRNGTSYFLNENYSPNSSLCPTLFYADYFKQPIYNIDVKRLQSILGSVPTAIIYSEVTDYQANFHIGFWTPQSQNIAQFDMPTWDWEQVYNTLRKKGLNDKIAYRQIREAIVLIHQLLTAFIADWYYLSINSFYEPRLLTDLNTSELTESSIDIFKPYIETLRKLQKLQGVAYLKEREFLDQNIDIDLNATSIQIASTAYKQKLTTLLTQHGYPLSEESQKDLKFVQSILNLSDPQANEVSQPILKQREKEYNERQKQLKQQNKRELKEEKQKERQAVFNTILLKLISLLKKILTNPILLLLSVFIFVAVLIFLNSKRTI